MSSLPICPCRARPVLRWSALALTVAAAAPLQAQSAGADERAAAAVDAAVADREWDEPDAEDESPSLTASEPIAETPRPDRSAAPRLDYDLRFQVGAELTREGGPAGDQSSEGRAAMQQPSASEISRALAASMSLTSSKLTACDPSMNSMKGMVSAATTPLSKPKIG